MALKPLNSVGGFSVGEIPANIILANGDITTSNANLTGNLYVTNTANVGNLRTDNLLHANGTAWDFATAAGNSGWIQYSDGADLAASANLTFDAANSILTVVGNIVSTNANLGNLVTANFGNFANDVKANGTVTAIGAVIGGNNVVINANGSSEGGQLVLAYAGVDGLTSQDDSTWNIDVNSANNFRIFTQYANGTVPNIALSIDGNSNVELAGNLTVNGVSNLGDVGNVHIFGGTTNQVLVTDGSGNLTWASGSTLSNGYSNVEIPLANSNVYINANGGVDQQWNFSTDSNMYVPGAIVWPLSGNIVENAINHGIDIYSSTQVRLIAASNTLLFDGNLTVPQNINASPSNYLTLRAGNAFIDIAPNANIGFAPNNYDYVLELAGPSQGGPLAVVNGDLYANNSGGLSGNITAQGNVTASNFQTTGSGGNISGANVIFANSFTSNGGLVDFSTNNANVQLGSNANVHLYGGNVGEVLQTDGAGNLNWYAISATGIQNGNSNVTIPDTNGNVYINANAGVDQQWNFGTNGTLYFPVVNSQTSIQEQRYGMGNLVGYNDGGWVLGEYNGTSYGTEGIRISPGIEGNVEVILPADQNAAGNALQLNNYVGNVKITANNNNWNFDNAGVLHTPGNIELGGNTIQDNSGGSGIQLYSGTDYAQLNYNNSSYVYVESSGVWLETNAGTVQLDNNGNVAMSGNLSVTGNITASNGNLGNLVTANFVNTGAIYNGSSNVVIDSSGNIGLSINGFANVLLVTNTGANLVGDFSANGNVNAGALISNTLTSNGTYLGLSAGTGGNYNINLTPAGTGNVDVAGAYITSLALTPLNPTDAASKQYVDTVAQGLHVHPSANVATTTDLANTTGAIVNYYQPGPEGVGATLTFTSGSLVSIDSVTLTANMRLLIKNESNAVWNGVYIYNNSAVITRSPDMEYDAQLAGGDFLFVESGNVNGDTGWVQTTDNVIIGTSNVVFSQFSGVGTYSGSNGISVVGTSITANVDNDTTAIVGGNITVKVSANLVTPNIGNATGNSLTITGNVLAENVTANSQMSAGNITVTNYANVDTLNANSNVISNNVTVNLELSGNTANFSGNVILSNLYANLNITSNTANISNITANNANVNYLLNGNIANFTGNLTALNADLGNLAVANYANVANTLIVGTGSGGNITGANLISVNYANINNDLTVNGNATFNSTTDGQTSITPDTVVIGLIGRGATGAPALNFQSSTYGATYDTSIVGTDGNGVTGSGTLTLEANKVIFDNTANANLGNYVVANFFAGDGGFLTNVAASGSLANGTSNVTIPVADGNVNISVGGNANVAVFSNTDAYLTGNLNIGNTAINWGTRTTNNIVTAQTITSVPVSGITGIEFLVKGIDTTGSKYSVATVQAVTDGTDVDFAIFGGVNLGGSTGSLSVDIFSGNLLLQVTPSSSNTTVWTTQYRII